MPNPGFSKRDLLIANISGQVLWLGRFGWAYGWVVDWHSQKFDPAIVGPAKFFSTLAGPLLIKCSFKQKFVVQLFISLTFLKYFFKSEDKTHEFFNLF